MQSLIDDGVRESQQLEFKQQFPDSRNPEAKFEFLRDVSSMANASGGDMIFGVQ